MRPQCHDRGCLCVMFATQSSVCLESPSLPHCFTCAPPASFHHPPETAPFVHPGTPLYSSPSLYIGYPPLLSFQIVVRWYPHVRSAFHKVTHWLTPVMLVNSPQQISASFALDFPAFARQLPNFERFACVQYPDKNTSNDRKKHGNLCTTTLYSDFKDV